MLDTSFAIRIIPTEPCSICFFITRIVNEVIGVVVGENIAQHQN